MVIVGLSQETEAAEEALSMMTSRVSNAQSYVHIFCLKPGHYVEAPVNRFASNRYDCLEHARDGGNSFLTTDGSGS